MATKPSSYDINLIDIRPGIWETKAWSPIWESLRAKMSLIYLLAFSLLINFAGQLSNPEIPAAQELELVFVSNRSFHSIIDQPFQIEGLSHKESSGSIELNFETRHTLVLNALNRILMKYNYFE